jgi:imidazolonepropionase-like amidohydrolase
MRHIINIIILIISLDSCAQTEVCHNYVIGDINIVDVKTGNVKPHQWIGIDSNRITKIYNNKVVPTDSTVVIDGGGKFLIPGLWDMHAHYHMNFGETANLWIANGVVGLRDMNGDMNTIGYIRKLMSEGKFDGPDIVSSGPVIDGLFAPVWMADVTDDSISAVRIVNKQKEDGVDFIKIVSHLNKESYFAIASESKKLKLDFAGHIPESVSAFEAISAGQKSIEHNLGILEATSFGSDTIIQYIQSHKSRKYFVAKWRMDMYDFLIKSHSDVLLDTLILKLANSNTWLCPTNVALEGIAYYFEDSIMHDYRNKFLSQDIKDVIANGPNDTLLLNAIKRRYEFERSLLKKMLDGGVKFLAGTDYITNHVYPGFSVHDELLIFKRSGFSNLQALQTATLNPAIYFNNQNDYGSIGESKIASVVILNSNPLDDIRSTKDIEAVFLKGKYFTKDNIDEMLETK